MADEGLGNSESGFALAHGLATFPSLCHLQTLVRFAVELARRVSLGEFRNRARWIVKSNHVHPVAKMVAAVEPSTIRTVPKKKVGRKVIIPAVAVFVNDILTVGHQKSMFTSPFQMLPCSSACFERLQLLIDVPEGEGTSGESCKCCCLPVCPNAFILVAHR